MGNVMNGELKNQKDDGVSGTKCNKRFLVELANMKNFATLAFEHPGLCHIGGKIFKNLDIQTKLSSRLVRKSWNDTFKKQASEIDLENVPKLSKFFEYTLKENKQKWRHFLKESNIEIPTMVLNSYLQYLLLRVIIDASDANNHDTPLLAFARTGNSKIVNFILHMKKNIIEDYEYSTALNSAAIYGHVNVAKLLRAYRNYAAISYASENGHLEVLKVMIDDDSRPMEVVNRFVDYSTIRAAACSGKVEVLKYFEGKLEKDWLEEALTTRNIFRETIIHDLADKGHLEMLKYLCQKAPFRNSIQRDSDDRTPIHHAASKGHFEIVKFLASYIPDPNSPDKNGWTPAECARSKGFLDIATYFLKLETKECTESEKTSQNHQEK